MTGIEGDRPRFIVGCDTGGTFTDIVVWSDDQDLSVFKAHTDPVDPATGILAALANAADYHRLGLDAFLARTDELIHGTTHSINAIITGRTARTAFLTSRGHPDILVLREGGRDEAFDNLQIYPEPYVPRALTFEVPGRIGADGVEIEPFDAAAMRDVARTLRVLAVEAVGVCLLWSIVEPAHERAVERLLAEELPGVPVTLSHRLNPSVREYRRAISTCIDASLRPLMGGYLGSLEARLGERGFAGKLRLLTSQGGMAEARSIGQSPILSLNSGPAVAPAAGSFLAKPEAVSDTLIIADTGGTTYDISLVRGDAIPRTRETWVGSRQRGLITGFPSVDIKSVGAGGGSIAWVDSGGLLHVGPQSAGAVPGPACYGKGGEHPTFTDASLVLGYIDPDYFLGGRDPLDPAAARTAIERFVATPLGLDIETSALAILEVITENMVQAIMEIALHQGVDPSQATLIGGGGAAGLNSVFIARRLGCRTLLIPELGPALSAAGALIAELSWEFRETALTTSANFDHALADEVLGRLGDRAHGAAGSDPDIERSLQWLVEARYARQAWDIEVPLPGRKLDTADDLAALTEAFHREHERLFTYRDERSVIEITGWILRSAHRPPGRPGTLGLQQHAESARADRRREVILPKSGRLSAPVKSLSAMTDDEALAGPAVIETPFTSILIDRGSVARRTPHGNLLIDLGG